MSENSGEFKFFPARLRRNEKDILSLPTKAVPGYQYFIIDVGRHLKPSHSANENVIDFENRLFLLSQLLLAFPFFRFLNRKRNYLGEETAACYGLVCFF